MRYCLLSFIFILMAATYGSAQSRIGLRVGPGYTTLAGKDSQDSGYRMGFHGGVYLEQPIYRSVKFEPGLQVATKGAKADYGSGNVTVTTRNSYLEFPLLLRFRTGQTFNLFVGLQPSFWFSSASIIHDNGYRRATNHWGPSGSWKEFDCSGMAGVASDLGNGFNLQLNYEQGVFNISKVYDSLYNRGIKLSLGRTF